MYSLDSDGGKGVDVGRSFSFFFFFFISVLFNLHQDLPVRRGIIIEIYYEM